MKVNRTFGIIFFSSIIAAFGITALWQIRQMQQFRQTWQLPPSWGRQLFRSVSDIGFLVPTPETSLNGFIQTDSEQSSSFYRVHFRGLNHHIATVALTESHGDEYGKCSALKNTGAEPGAIPFQLMAGRGVVFNHATPLARGGQIGWMQLLFDDQGSCLEISAKGLTAGELEPQDLILLLASLQRES